MKDSGAGGSSWATRRRAWASNCGVATSTVRAWEAGTRTPRFGLRPRIARLLDVSVVEVHRWFDKAALADGMAVPAWLGHLASLEQGAAEVWTYEPVVVPGLLQTRDYAFAVQHADSVTRTDQEMDHRVEHRLARQRVLTREPHPLVLSAVIDESVLWRVAGDRAVMATQLDHLVHMADRPNVDVRVLPLDTGEFSSRLGELQYS